VEVTEIPMEGMKSANADLFKHACASNISVDETVIKKAMQMLLVWE
jgi:hypothetical protein